MESGRAGVTLPAMRTANPRSATMAILLAGLVVGATARAQPVQGDVKSIGFQANVQSRFVIREGRWIPIVVELQAAGSEHFSGALQVELSDLDGDRVSFVEPSVAVTGGGTLRRVWCYAVAHRRDTSRSISVDVVGEDGALVASLPVPAFELIGSETQVLLDVSERPVAELRALDAGSAYYYAQGWSERRVYRPTCVATLGTRDLPDRWIGLEAAQIVVWDDPNPELVSDAQLKALAEWVRNGGQLIVGVGAQWSKLRTSALADVLPYSGDKPSLETHLLPQFARRFTDAESTRFKNPLSVTSAELAPGATALLLDQAESGQVINLVAQRLVGSGRVLATAARLRDLFAATTTSAFLHELVEVNPVSDKFRQNATNEFAALRLGAPALATDILAGIEFRRQAGLRVLAAFAFVAAYILLSTFVSWGWLVRRKLTHASWTVFAAFAIVASLLSSGAVGMLRGVTSSVQSVSFVDLDDGAGSARASVFVGYKSPTRAALDLSLAGEGNFLRPLTSSGLGSTYQTPERYTATRGALDGVLLRATLKEFEGVWRGEHEGRLRSRLVADRATGRLTDESWLQNELGQVIDGGYVLFIDPRLSGVGGAVPPRVSGLTKRTDRSLYWGQSSVPPAVQVLAVPLGAMKPGDRLARPGQLMYAETDLLRQRFLAGAADARSEPMLPTLWSLQNGDWIGSLTNITGGRLDRTAAAALLASTTNLYLPNRIGDPDFEKFGAAVSVEGLMDLDITHWLVRGQAVVLLSVAGAPPLPLTVDGAPLAKSRLHGRSFYRIRVPLEYVGRPPTRTLPTPGAPE